MMIQSHSNVTLEAALAYSKAGLSILPTNKEDKRPTIEEWKSRQKAIPAEDVINADFKNNGDCVAIICGKVSGNTETIDFDKGGKCFGQWAKMVDAGAPGLIGRLVRQKTQNNGKHVSYRCPDAIIPGNQKLAADASGETTIETRGEGGYFLAYPSDGYKIEQGKFSQLPVIKASERQILIQAALALNQFIPKPKLTTLPQRDRTDGLSPGDDYNQNGKVDELLTLHGWVSTGGRTVDNDGTHWRRPGKDKGQSATLYDNGIFYNFSSNAHPFELNSSYQPFSVYGLLEHNGDFQAAARELGRQGYGSPQNGPRKDVATTIIEKTVDEKDIRPLEFPHTIMDGAAGYFSQVYSEVMEAPQHFLFMAFLTSMGAYFAPKLTIRSSLKTQPRIYCVLVGESASERKSTTLNQAISHFKSVFEDFNVCWGIGSAEGLHKVLKSDEDNEIVISLLGTLLVFDEFKAFVSKCQIDTSVLLPIVNSLFENNLYETHTKHHDIKIENAYLSMLAATTRETYERIYTPAFIHIGFPNRVFLVPGTAQRKFSIPPLIDQKEKQILQNHLIQIQDHIKYGIEFDFTSEAKYLYQQWYMKIEESVHAKRLDTYSLRFMQLLATNNLKKVIDAEIVQHAIDLCDWQLEVRKIHDPIDADTSVAKMEQNIRRHLERHPLKDYKLKQKTSANRAGLWIYTQALNNLRKANEIDWDKKNKQWFLLS